MAEWYCCNCNECLYMDLNDRNRYDNNEAYCTKRYHYYPMSDRACERYFVYDENRRSSSSCYLTTIVCNILNYPDNSDYLVTLRKFRDNYMRLKPNLLPILYEYDVIGPLLSKYISDDKNKNQVASNLLNNYIIPVTNLIKSNNYEQAINKYIEMVNKLKQLYNVDITLNIENTNEITGKGYLLKKSNLLN